MRKRCAMVSPDRPLLRALQGEAVWPPPIWLMRQAGRYLPEYKDTRTTAGSFLDLCLSVDHAVEVTLQPLRRFNFDASIMFSDILMVPYGLKHKVWFEVGEGPRMVPIQTVQDLSGLTMDGFHDRVAPVYQILTRLRAEIPATTTLIGFAAAPWTIATYMVEGGPSKTHETIRTLMWQQPEWFQRLIDIVVEATVSYLCAQVRAGANVIQLFDTWAMALGGPAFDRWVIEPSRRIVEALKAAHPDTPVICFPRGAGAQYQRFAAEVPCDGLSLDATVPLEWARASLGGKCLQGNLDPILLVAGGQALIDEVRRIGTAMRGYPFIFNLGHGILKQTPIEHVEAMVAEIRSW